MKLKTVKTKSKGCYTLKDAKGVVRGSITRVPDLGPYGAVWVVKVPGYRPANCTTLAVATDIAEALTP